MWLAPEHLMLASILVLAALVRGAFGFADALLAMPLMCLVVPVATAAPLMCLTGFLSANVILFREWKSLHLPSTLRLMVFGALATPVGVWGIRYLDDRIVKGVLGLVVVGFAIWSLSGRASLRLKTERWAPVFGIAAGLLGGAQNTAGPPLAIYATLREWTPERFRTMMQSYSLLSSVWVMLLHSVAGNVTRATFQVFVIACPFVIMATLLGQRLTRGMVPRSYVRWLYLLLLVLGVSLLISCSRPLIKTAQSKEQDVHTINLQETPCLSSRRAIRLF
ncbi:MAG: sulfite exporter TauE/SafE family protein [Planctomycetaceae bacterium]